MNEKLKSRRNKIVAPRRAQPSIQIDPLAVLQDQRREFYTRLQDSVRDLDPLDDLPETVQQIIRSYATSQSSEDDLRALIGFNVGQVRQILLLLLDAEALRSTNLSPIIMTFARENVNINDENKHIEYNKLVKLLLEKYIRKNLSVYLEDEDITPRTNVSIEKLQEDLKKLMPVDSKDEGVIDNPFENLFSIPLPEDIVKKFLVGLTKTEGSVRSKVFQFVKEHRFEPIKILFENNFKPETPADWKHVLPQQYYEQFPSYFWNLTSWADFKKYDDLSKNLSLDINDLIKYKFYTKKSVLRVGGDMSELSASTEKVKVPIHPSRHAPFMTIPNRTEIELLQRTRPWVDGLVSVLIKPDTQTIYQGKPYHDGYYFPQNFFYRDLANEDIIKTQDPKSNLFTIRSNGIKHNMYIYHLMKDGNIIPQTHASFEKGLNYIKNKKEAIIIPNVVLHFLMQHHANLAPADYLFFQRKFRSEISLYLSSLYDEKLDTDKIANDIEKSAYDSSHTLNEYLKNIFNVFFLINPRYYYLDKITTVFKERLNMFFYNINKIHELPIEFYFPQYHFLEKKDQEEFLSWRNRSMEVFILESIYNLFSTNYPILKTNLKTHNIKQPNPDWNVGTGSKLALLVPYKNKYISLPPLAKSILQHEEFNIDGKNVDKKFIASLTKYFNLEKAQYGLGAYFMDNEYELANDFYRFENIKEDEKVQVVPHLNNFKEKAYAFLNEMKSG